MAIASNSVDFNDLDHALHTWKATSNRPEIWPTVKGVINLLTKQLGEAVRIHVPESQSYIGVTFVGQPKQVGAYIGNNHVDHIVELPGSVVREKTPSYWRTILNPNSEGASISRIELPAWKPHKDSEARKQSALFIAEALLSARENIYKSHLRELLSIAVWKHTESDGKYTTRYRSLGAINSPGEKLNHEHVVTRKSLVDALLNEPDRFAEILESATACTVLEEEHRRIMQVEKEDKNLRGWDRYRAAKIPVYDLLTGDQIV